MNTRPAFPHEGVKNWFFMHIGGGLKLVIQHEGGLVEQLEVNPKKLADTLSACATTAKFILGTDGTECTCGAAKHEQWVHLGHCPANLAPITKLITLGETP